MFMTYTGKCTTHNKMFALIISLLEPSSVMKSIKYYICTIRHFKYTNVKLMFQMELVTIIYQWLEVVQIY